MADLGRTDYWRAQATARRAQAAAYAAEANAAALDPSSDDAERRRRAAALRGLECSYLEMAGQLDEIAALHDGETRP